MMYFYNYSFLDKWMEANRKITNREIMKAMGTTSNAAWRGMYALVSTTSLSRMGDI